METNIIAPPREARSEARKVLRVGATMLFKDTAPMQTKTIDISAHGIALFGPDQVVLGTLCGVRFTTMIQGRIEKVEAVAKVVYCICVGTTGFRIGLQFNDLDAASKTALSQIVNAK